MTDAQGSSNLVLAGCKFNGSAGYKPTDSSMCANSLVAGYSAVITVLDQADSPSTRDASDPRLIDKTSISGGALHCSVLRQLSSTLSDDRGSSVAAVHHNNNRNCDCSDSLGCLMNAATTQQLECCNGIELPDAATCMSCSEISTTSSGAAGIDTTVSTGAAQYGPTDVWPDVDNRVTYSLLKGATVPDFMVCSGSFYNGSIVLLHAAHILLVFAWSGSTNWWKTTDTLKFHFLLGLISLHFYSGIDLMQSGDICSMGFACMMRCSLTSCTMIDVVSMLGDLVACETLTTSLHNIRSTFLLLSWRFSAKAFLLFFSSNDLSCDCATQGGEHKYEYAFGYTSDWLRPREHPHKYFD